VFYEPNVNQSGQSVKDTDQNLKNALTENTKYINTKTLMQVNPNLINILIDQETYDMFIPFLGNTQ